MNFLKALKICLENPRKWFRPVSWKGIGTALCAIKNTQYQSEKIHFVPSSRGGTEGYFLSPSVMLGKWEIVEPLDVNRESKRD